MTQHYLTHARIVLADQILEDASLLIEDGIIAAINPESVADNIDTIDLAGRLLMPGMIDLHCDALEKEVEPRPNVHFPLDFAVAQADKRNASSGITTVFHAIAFANEELGLRNNDFAANIARAVHAWAPHGLIDNRVHCRYEITDETGLPVLLDLIEHDDMHLLSLMDHTPGQGQFKNMAAYRDYLARSYKKSEAELDAIIDKKLASAEGAFERAKTLIAAAHAKGVSVASHDDDTRERIETMSGLDVQISEFPINIEAASAAREHGLSTVFGAPNILRGKSQSGSMKALDAIEANVADCLCADYAPAALIVAVIKLPGLTDISLADAVKLVTLNPAKAAGLNDRGEIAVGKRADLIMVDLPAGLPQVGRVWLKGQTVYQGVYDHG
ncbi:MAG: alpha-D-ribose 1-methylphosphonate 5-triphosphate diphosphatase [Gammaproteobacteria bacterium]|nr:alpha-D-ribose 1-methylphosphonate 5-triphosphate diphosphatase [Gammaproteobacteria bacterium]